MHKWQVWKDVSETVTTVQNSIAAPKLPKMTNYTWWEHAVCVCANVSYNYDNESLHIK